MAGIEFSLNGSRERIDVPDPTCTLLEWLREARGLTGTKEGCNEGDCGACTVMLSERQGESTVYRAVNSCVLFLPQLAGKSVRTVEGVSGPEGELHPVQQAMIEQNGSQCGFCTPGFVMSLVAAHHNRHTAHDDVLAGNLCRCTGYAPIIRAAETVAEIEPPPWLDASREPTNETGSPVQSQSFFVPGTADELAEWYADNPNATLVAGATDVGLWVTKQLRELGTVGFVSRIRDLSKIEIGDDFIEIGAALSLTDLQSLFAGIHPSFSELLRRFGSVQVRNAATIGGNIANGSPIGDCPPALIALGSMLRLRRGSERRTVPLEDFFVAYGKQDRQPGEFVEAVLVPKQEDRLGCYKISKRFDQDISAVCGCFNIAVENGTVKSARIAYGGMAATPKRALNAESALLGQNWSLPVIEDAMQAVSEDYSPISDMRASSRYRMDVAKNLLLKYFLEHGAKGAPLHVLDCSP